MERISDEGADVLGLDPGAKEKKEKKTKTTKHDNYLLVSAVKGISKNCLKHFLHLCCNIAWCKLVSLTNLLSSVLIGFQLRLFFVKLHDIK